MKIITSGVPYIDIDAYACCIAYAELLEKQGEPAQAVSTGRWNESISATVRSWNGNLLTGYIPTPEDSYTLIDLSDPKHFDVFVDTTRIDLVLDHHPGFEEYWKNHPQTTVQIETIGAAATQVYECWEKAHLLQEMSQTSARLLLTAILDNTFNFKAQITTERDKTAYQALLPLANLPEDWPAQYFGECQASIVRDIPTALSNDFKQLELPGFPGRMLFAQLITWHAADIVTDYAHVIQNTLESINPQWFLNLVSVDEGVSYFLSADKNIQKSLGNLLNIQFEGNVARADLLWLRKEVIKKALG